MESKTGQREPAPGILHVRNQLQPARCVQQVDGRDHDRDYPALGQG